MALEVGSLEGVWTIRMVTSGMELEPLYKTPVLLTSICLKRYNQKMAVCSPEDSPYLNPSMSYLAFSCCGKTPKTTFRGDFTWLTYSDHSLLWREVHSATQSRIPGGTDAKVIEEHFLLACTSWVVQFALFYNPGYLLRVGTTNINDYSRKCPTDFPMGQANSGIFSIEVSSS